MKKKLIIAITMALLIAYIGRVIYVNKNRLNVDEIFYEVGEECIYNGFGRKITGFNFMSKEDVENTFNITIDNKGIEGMNFLVIDMEVRNLSETEQKTFNPSSGTVVSNAWSSSPSMAVCDDVNKDNIYIEPEETNKIYTLVAVFKAQFTEEDWDNMKNLQFDLFLQQLPESIIMKCNY